MSWTKLTNSGAARSAGYAFVMKPFCNVESDGVTLGTRSGNISPDGGETEAKGSSFISPSVITNSISNSCMFLREFLSLLTLLYFSLERCYISQYLELSNAKKQLISCVKM